MAKNDKGIHYVSKDPRPEYRGKYRSKGTSNKPKEKQTLYQRAYHTMAQLPDAAARRKYLDKAIKNPTDIKFVEALEKVAGNNPHFMISKGDPNYQKVRSKTLISKTMKQKDFERNKKDSQSN